MYLTLDERVQIWTLASQALKRTLKYTFNKKNNTRINRLRKIMVKMGEIEGFMKYKKINKEDYKGEPVQYVGYHVLHHKDLQLPEPEVFFVEDDEEKKEKI